ncbi:MAG: hypothetical protein LBV29_09385 [Azoarcus sp.]|nr:hypothetical protein [Azoarcus sp.]
MHLQVQECVLRGLQAKVDVRQARIVDDGEEVVDHRIVLARGLDRQAFGDGEEQLELDRADAGGLTPTLWASPPCSTSWNGMKFGHKGCGAISRPTSHK